MGLALQEEQVKRGNIFVLFRAFRYKPRLLFLKVAHQHCKGRKFRGLHVYEHNYTSQRSEETQPSQKQNKHYTEVLIKRK
jgi:hypothetical protein